jgi:hypothetical protein
MKATLFQSQLRAYEKPIYLGDKHFRTHRGEGHLTFRLLPLLPAEELRNL